MPGDTALVVGATGLVGSHCLDVLLESGAYERVIAFTRRPLGREHPRLTETIVDFAKLAELEPFPVGDVFCALGTTMAKAGSQYAFLKVDIEYPSIIAERSAAAGAKQFVLVSSVGADPKSGNFYLRVKAELEKAVSARPFESVHIFRTSVLMGSRAEFRLGERLGVLGARAGEFAMVGKWRKYRPIAASTVAAAMVNAARQGKPGRHVYHYDEILALAALP
jgi:uncharacterized protein YbjT (DUF2867 family)